MAQPAAAALQLRIETPTALVFDGRVRSLTAEDASGRFGLRPRATPLVAALVPSVLTYRAEDGAERLVAAGSGALRSDGARVVVTLRHAMVCESLEEVQLRLEQAAARTAEGEAAMRQTFRTLYRGLLQALGDEWRTM
ncbi:MAG: F0F1 ATP synthase subunit epsilon [Proteobacteria bacterium]|nr:F0F1 ATP synthase subunit epsilon [Pseudomonadota bacterium]